jgi:photosystem II stability/assembly factor-like uncharacterized protein
MKKLALFFGCTVVLLSADAFGPKWTNASNGLIGSVPGVTALVIDRSTGSTLYALTSANTVFNLFKSIDGGANWKALPTISGVQVLAVDPTWPTIYAGTAHGIMTSTDGGTSWTSTGLSDTSISNLVIDPLTPSTLYAGGNGHLYKSTDQGGRWTDLNLPPPPCCGGGFIAALVLDPLTPSRLYVALGFGAGGSFLKSLDGGQSWKVIYANAGPFYNTSSNLVIDPSNPSTLYRINPLLKSTDGGISWSPTGFTKTISALAVDPTNSNTLYLSTGKMIFKSLDGGQSWNALDTVIPPTGSFVFNPDSSTIYATTSGGVFRSADGALNWADLNTGLRLLDIEVLVGDPVDPATLYAGGNDGLFKSVDSGESWTRLATFQVAPSTLSVPPYSIVPPVLPGGVRSLLIDFMNPAVLYVSLARSVGSFWSLTDVNLAKSTDGGATWNYFNYLIINANQYLPGNARELLAMDPTDPNTLYLQWGNDYDSYGLYKTNDGGANWDQTGLGGLNGLNALAIDPTTPATLYAATNSTSGPTSECALADCSVIGGVQRSTDGGATWNFVGLAKQDVSLLAIDPLQPNVLYAAVTSSQRGLFKSTDSGASWSPINNGLGDFIVNAFIVDPDHTNVLYLATSGYGVFKSSDGGATWSPFNNGLTNLDVRSLAIVPQPSNGRHGKRPDGLASSALFAGTPGGIFKLEQFGR